MRSIVRLSPIFFVAFTFLCLPVLWFTQSSLAVVGGTGGSTITMQQLTNAVGGVNSNLFYPLSRTSNNAALNADGFVFGGDSFIASDVAAGFMQPTAGTGKDWPTRLLQTSNYFHYSYSYNFGSNNSTVPWWSNNYVLTARTVKPATGQNAYFFFQCGQNAPTGTDTNWWLAIMSMARSDGYKIVALTGVTNQNANALFINTNNLFIRAASAYYDYLVDVDQLVTNYATQFDASTAHPNATFNQNLANYICANVVPTNSAVFNRVPPERYHTFDVLTVKTNLDTVGLSVRGFGVGVTGPRMEISHDGSSAGTIQSIDTSGNYAPIYLQGNPTFQTKGYFQSYTGWFGGVLVETNLSITRGTFVLGALGAAITNIVATNSVLDFASTGGGTNSDLAITWPGGCSSNDVVLLNVPATLQLPGAVYTAFTSNGAVYTRFTNTRTNGVAVDPPVGMVNWVMFKR